MPRARILIRIETLDDQDKPVHAVEVDGLGDYQKLLTESTKLMALNTRPGPEFGDTWFDVDIDPE